LVGSRDLHGKRILITAGGTREAIDPVRFIGNNSSGKQGTAIASAAAARGASVTLIGANIPPIKSEGIQFVSVTTATELDHEINQRISSSDILIQAAAVSDFKVKAPSETKLKRSVLGDVITLELVANPDILAEAVSRIRSEALACIVVGFAAETVKDAGELSQLAKAKLKSKGCDILVANDVSAGKVFGSDKNNVLILSKQGTQESVTGSKTLVANAILDILTEYKAGN
jgi:phosphopantothenoylcysteine decarboxylase/phosphopantothenate--cysteine ligase